MNTATTRSIANGAVRQVTDRAASTRLRANIGTAPAATNASGVVPPPTAPAVSTAQPESTRSEFNEQNNVMIDNDYVGADFLDEIATHECGHVVALAAAGLTEEFISVTIVPENGVRGLTVRSGASLTQLSDKLSEYAQNLADGRQEGLEAFRNFVLTTPAVCLPHICFFFGGGSIDRLLGRENRNRNAIDANCIRQMVVPSMLLPPLSDEDLTGIQEKVDEFLFNVFKKEKALFGRIYRAIVERKTLGRNSIPDVLKDMQACADRSEGIYKSLLASIENWHSGKVRQLPYFQV